MNIDLDTLNTSKTRVQKSVSSGYMSILNAVPVGKTRVQKAANKPKQPARKAVHPQPYKPTPESAPSSTIGNSGHPNATSNLSGAPKATDKPTSFEAVLASAIAGLAAAVKVMNPPPRDTTPQALADTLAEDRRRQEARDWNDKRSAAQKQGFTFHAAKSDHATVNLGKSAHAVRMNGNVFAPVPTTARKAEERRAWFNDS